MSVKQVVLVRTDLKMSKGKLAVQVSHSSTGALLPRLRHSIEYNGEEDKYSTFLKDCENSKAIVEWLNNSFTKICLKVNDLEELEKYEQQCIDNGIGHCKITDNGLTVFNSVPTVTCLAIGPYWSDSINSITSDLKLL